MMTGGQEHEFKQFYESHRAKLRTDVRGQVRARRLTDVSVDVDAVVQDTFTEAYKKWSTIVWPERWIYPVASRTLWEYVDREWKHENGLRDLTRVAQIVMPDPANRVCDTSHAAELVEPLPPKQREALVLSRAFEWPVNDIATEQGVAPSTVYVHIHNGTHTVRQRGAAWLERLRNDTALHLILAALAGGLVALAVWRTFAAGAGVSAAAAIGWRLSEGSKFRLIKRHREAKRNGTAIPGIPLTIVDAVVALAIWTGRKIRGRLGG